MIATSVGARKLRFWIHLTSAYLAKYRLTIITIASLLVLVILALPIVWSKISRANVVTIGYVGAYSLDTIPSQVLTLATKPLITTDDKGNPVALLASHWTVSDDGKTYVVFLKDNLKWHDGSEVSAKDIAIAIKNVTITALNNKAIEFKLPNPISSFPIALDKPVFKAKTFYGTGEFRIVGIDKVGETVKKITLLPKNSQLPKVEIKFYPTEELALNALKIGEIRTATIAHTNNLNSWPNLSVEKSTDYSQIVTLFYNNNNQFLGSKELRQALSYAINKSEYDGQLATGPNSANNWAFNETVKRYEYNSAKAKELLAKSKIENLQITLSTTSDLTLAAQKIKDDWASIGVKTTVKVEKSIPHDFQALLVVNKISPDPDQYALWHSTQKETNITGYKNVKVDKLLEDARNTRDDGQRKDLYFDFQKFLVEDAPTVFLYYPNKYNVTYKNILPLVSKLPRNP